MSTAKSFSDFSDKAAGAADKAKDLVDESGDKLSDTLRDAQSGAAPLFNKASRQAKEFAGQGVDAASRAAKQFSDGVSDFADGAISYTKKNPMTALVVAAAAGAIVYGLVKAFSSDRE